MRRFVKEGNDFNNASDTKAAIEWYGEGGEMKRCYITDAEIQESFQNVKKYSMADIQLLKNFSSETESLETLTFWESFYHWENFRIMVLHKVRKSLPGIQKS